MPFKIDLLDSASKSPTEDIAGVRISVDKAVLTRVSDLVNDRVRDHFIASVTGLAFWFADNWWRLRCEPMGNPSFVSTDWRLRHEMSSGTTNELWPPIMIYGGGPRVMIAPAYGHASDDGNLRYFDITTHSLLAAEYEKGVDDFLSNVVTSFAGHPDRAALAKLIMQLNIERADDELAGWRRLEACLSYDADQAPDEIIGALIAMEASLGGEAVEEAAIANPGSSAPAMLQRAVAAAEASDLEVDFSSLSPLRNMADPHGLTPWQAAEDAACELRQLLQLPDVVSGNVLGDILQTRWEDLKKATATARNLSYGAKAETSGDCARLALQMGPQIDRRFELGRMIGDEVWTQGNGFGVVSRTKTDRQKFQRAFAQALLCPISGLRKIIDFSRPTEEDIVEAARHYYVRPSVIMTILINRGYLPWNIMADTFEAA